MEYLVTLIRTKQEIVTVKVNASDFMGALAKGDALTLEEVKDGDVVSTAEALDVESVNLDMWGVPAPLEYLGLEELAPELGDDGLPIEEHRVHYSLAHKFNPALSPAELAKTWSTTEVAFLKNIDRRSSPYAFMLNDGRIVTIAKPRAEFLRVLALNFPLP